MVLGWRTTSLLVLLLVGGGAESGDGDDDVGEEDENDEEARIRCSSHISIQGSSLTCKLLPYPDQDQDEEDSIQTMSLCYTDWDDNSRAKCLKAVGDTINSSDLDPVMELNLTAHLSRGGDVSTAVDLKKIVRPKSPMVWNVTFDQEFNQVVVHVRTPYHNDFLKVENQMFQLQISSSASNMIQNISSKDFLTIDMHHLDKDSQYEIRVRSIPYRFLQGTWSEWSSPYSYTPPRGELISQQHDYLQVDKVAKVLGAVVLPVLAIILIGKTKIFTCMWPRIPRPKETLVHICKTNKGVLLSLKPEVFSSLRVSPLERREDAEPSTVPLSAPSASLDSASLSTAPSATHTSSTLCSGCSSVDTETSTLVSSSCGEDSPTSTSPLYDLPLPPPGPSSGHSLTPPPGDRQLEAGEQAEVRGQQEEAYVTMSSFRYQN